jgi:sirohydrochlorin ferrochelatase
MSEYETLVEKLQQRPAYSEAATEAIRRMIDEREKAAEAILSLLQEREEDQAVIAVWRGRTVRAEAERDALIAEYNLYKLRHKTNENTSSNPA